jgi:osmotically-inducible protein OsmY
MTRNAPGIVLLLASGGVWSATQMPEPGAATLPSTAIERESNNPAKAAVKAKEAMAREKTEQKAAAEESPPAQPGPLADNTQLVQSVEAALRNDPRTAALGVGVKLDENRLVGLHGVVPSLRSRTTVIDVATKVAGAARVKSYLEVRQKK